jgi:glutamyl-tRNA reductase
MHIIVVGVDHTTAPIALRERLSCSSHQVPQVLQSARQVAQECVLLSTCNRVELYAVCLDAEQGCQKLLTLLCNRRQIASDELRGHTYQFSDEQAIAHLCGVACGLYSLVPGEPQIQGQVANALELAQKGGFGGQIMSALFRCALVTGKRARTETGISRNAASVSHVAVQVVRNHLPQFASASVLLVGSGKMSEQAARNLRDNGAQRLVIVNRTQQHAVDLAETLQAQHRPFTELEEALIEADVVISSTMAPHVVITTAMMQQVVQQRAGRSLLLIDIAMPRDVDPEVSLLDGIHLYNVDDLQAEVDKGIRLRLQEVSQVQEIIAAEVESFKHWLSSLSVVTTISDLRRHVEQLRQQELMRTVRQLSPTLSERELAAVQELTNRLTNKLLHVPTLRLKDAAVSGQGHIYAEATRYLFGLEENIHADQDRNESKQTSSDTDQLGYAAATSAVAQS